MLIGLSVTSFASDRHQRYNNHQTQRHYSYTPRYYNYTPGYYNRGTLYYDFRTGRFQYSYGYRYGYIRPSIRSYRYGYIKPYSRKYIQKNHNKKHRKNRD